MNKITVCFWFDTEAEDAANYYVDTFKSAPGEHEAKIGRVQKYPKTGQEITHKEPGSVMTAEFELDGMKFMGLNGGKLDQFKLSGATSFIVPCETQEEIDHFWGKLSAVPEAEQCGWCTDKFGITWQIVPRILDELLADPTKTEKVMAAFMPMKKMEIHKLEEAANA